jgi:plasmid stabilization system protein ParE
MTGSQPISPSRAVLFADKLEKRIRSLELNPQLGRAPRDERLKRLGYRILIIDSFLIFYVVAARTVEIHRVLRGARHLHDVL